MLGNLTRRSKQMAKGVVDKLPAHVRRRLVNWTARSRGVQDREILGRSLRVEGEDHSDVDLDDAWLIGLVAESDGFVDIGCNVGFFSIASCVLRPTAQVLAIDANPECAAVTAANLVRNGFGARTRTVAMFMSASRGEIGFATAGLSASGSSRTSLSWTAQTVGSALVVPTDTLDAVLEQTGFVPDLIKIDVEGAERDVLAGATQTANHHRPRFMVEMHSGGDLVMEENTADVLAWCEEQGYDAWYLATGERLTSSQTVAHRGRYHLLLQSSGESLPSIIEGIPQASPIDIVLRRLAERSTGPR